MKRVKVFLILVLLILIYCGENNVYAMETSGFSTEKMPENEKEIFLGNVDITMFFAEPQKEPIKCFDVNENGLIAIGTENVNDKKISIYSLNGEFQYGYKFSTDGSFGVELDNEIVNIYFVRSDVSIAVNSAGEIENVLKISNTTENNTYWNYYVRATRRIIGEQEYILKNDIGFWGLLASSYSQLYKIDSSGVQCLIYDANSYQFWHVILLFFGIIVFVCVVVFAIIKQFKNNQQENKHME